MTKHLFIATDDPGIGGVAQYNHLLMSGLLELGYRITYFQLKATDDNLLIPNKKLDINHILWTPEEPEALKDLIKLLIDKSKRPDLIICSNSFPFSNLEIKALSLQFGIPYLVLEHFVQLAVTEEFYDKLGELLYHYEQAKSVIACSYDTLNSLQNLYRLPKNKGQVIYYGRPPQYFTPIDLSVRERLRQELGIPSNAVVCFTVGAITSRKGYQYQLAAIKQLIHSPVWSQLYFVWVGASYYYPEFEVNLKEAIQQLGVTDKVKFLGQRGDVADLLNAVDIFVFPSQLDSLGLAIVEAMAKKIPVVATKVGGVPEALGDTGKLITDPKIDPQGTVRELSATIEDWAINSELRHSIGEACFARASVMFTEERMIKETVAVIERALLPAEDSDTNLLPFALKEINPIVFPDWSDSEESLSLELARVLRAVAAHPNKLQMAFLINLGNFSEEDANLIVSDVVMNLLMEENLDLTNELEIFMVGQLSEIEWSALLPRIYARIILEKEDREAIARLSMFTPKVKAETISSFLSNPISS